MALNPDIRDQAYHFFIEEAPVLLQRIEAGLLTLRTERSTAKIHNLMRAAHSIKGGSASVGLEAIAALAHRLENIFKALYSEELEIDTQLESQLLCAYDHLRLPLTEQVTTGAFDAPQALSIAEPIFSQLEEQLSHALAQVDHFIPSSSELGVNIALSIFEVDVAEGLNHLAAVVANPENYEVAGELRAQAEVFNGFAMLLDLPGFGAIAETAQQALNAHPEEALLITQLALADFQAGREAVLREDDTKGGSPCAALLALATAQPKQDLDASISLLEEVFGSVDTPETEVVASSALIPIETDSLRAVTPMVPTVQIPSELLNEPLDAPETLDAAVQSIEQLFESLPSLADTPHVVSSAVSDTPIHSTGEKQRQTHTNPSATPKLTLRVDLERLERMNNLVGELTINRNSLSLQNEQLQNSVQDLRKRFSQFENIVSQLQEFSDQMLVGDSVGMAWSKTAARRKFERLNRGKRLAQAEADSGKHRDKHRQPATVQPTRRYGQGYPKRKGLRSIPSPAQLSVDHSQFDTLEMDRYGVLHSKVQGILEDMAQLEESVDDIALFAKATNQTLEQQRQMHVQLRDELMWARMLPVGEVLNRFPRLLRDLSTTYHKPVSLRLTGTGVLVDRAVLEKLYDPLVHLLRNSFDHGIEPPEMRRQLGKPEQGDIEISAYHKGSQTIIEVKDDGRGVQPELIRNRALERGLLSAEQLSQLNDIEVIQLIFQPGFSTANQVTELSGRGVGLDVLGEQLRALKGTVTVTSSPGRGTTFTLRLPLTLTIAKLLICTVSDRTLAFPSESIEEIVIPKAGQRQPLGKQQFLYWREQPVPIYRVTDLLDYSCPLPETPLSPALQAVPSPDDWELPMLLLKQGQQFCALEIECLLTEQELVIKPFGVAIAPPSYTYGCTILGDGSLIPVIDGVELLNHFLGEGTGEWHKTRESQHRLSDRVNATGLAVVSKLLEEPNLQENSLESQERSHSSPHLLTSAPVSSSSNWTTNKTKSTLSRILVVDDAVTLRRTLALSLEKAGFRVLQAGDGREAIEQLQEHPSTQLVICDVEMPNMNGFDFLNYRRQEAQLSQIPVIMLTSRSNHKHQWLATHLGATAYFTKPYIEQTFLKAIKDIISSHELPES